MTELAGTQYPKWQEPEERFIQDIGILKKKNGRDYSNWKTWGPSQRKYHLKVAQLPLNVGA